MSGSLAGGSFPSPDVPRRDIPDLIAGLPKPKGHPDFGEANREMKRSANWHKVQPVPSELENQLTSTAGCSVCKGDGGWEEESGEWANCLGCTDPHLVVKDYRVAEPIREIAAHTGSTVEEVEKAVIALLSPPKTKRRH